MLDYIEERKRAEALNERQRLDERQRRVREGSPRMRSDADALGSGPRSDRLWVDKYSPKRFNELLSEDKVNEVLHWIKAWDGVVFQKAPPKPPSGISSSSSSRRSTAAGAAGAGTTAAAGAAGAAGAANPPCSPRCVRSARTDDRCTRFCCSRVDPASMNNPRARRGEARRVRGRRGERLGRQKRGRFADQGYRRGSDATRHRR